MAQEPPRDPSPAPPPPGLFVGAPPPLVGSHDGLTEFDPWAPAEPPERARSPFIGLGAISEALEVIALAILMFLAVRAVGQNFVVDGSSMQPTFEDGQLLIVNRLAYRTFDVSWIPGVDEEEWRPFGEPQPGDVVVFNFSNDPRTGPRDFIKRIVAVPGQTVEVRDGVLRVDGVPIDEPYIAEQPTYETAPTTVLPGMVWVLGDNRNRSFDSHSWGMLEQSKIIGRADIVYWPLGNFHVVDHHDPEPATEGLALSPSMSN